MRYHHLGIPTAATREGEVYLERFQMHVVGFDSNPYGVEWLRFDADCTLPELVKTVPHVAFEVADLLEAIEGKRVLIAPNRPSEGVTVAFIEHDGAPVEFLQFDQSGEQEVLTAFEKARAAMFAGDREALEASFAEDYRSVSIHGTTGGREEVLGTFGKGLVRLERFDATDLRVHVDGNTGILRGEGIVAGSFAAQTFEHHVLFCDIYERRNGRWQVVFSQMTEVRSA